MLLLVIFLDGWFLGGKPPTGGKNVAGTFWCFFLKKTKRRQFFDKEHEGKKKHTSEPKKKRNLNASNFEKKTQHTVFNLIFFTTSQAGHFRPSWQGLNGGTCHLSAPAQLPSKKTTKMGLNLTPEKGLV